MQRAYARMTCKKIVNSQARARKKCAKKGAARLLPGGGRVVNTFEKGQTATEQSWEREEGPVSNCISEGGREGKDRYLFGSRTSITSSDSRGEGITLETTTLTSPSVVGFDLGNGKAICLASIRESTHRKGGIKAGGKLIKVGGGMRGEKKGTTDFFAGEKGGLR